MELESKRAELKHSYPWLEKLLIIIPQKRLWKVNQSEQRCCFWFHSYQKKIRCQMAIFVWRQIIKGSSFRIMKVEKLKMNTWTPRTQRHSVICIYTELLCCTVWGEGALCNFVPHVKGTPEVHHGVWCRALCPWGQQRVSGPTLTYVEREVCSRDFLGLWSGSGICSGHLGHLT